MSRVEEVRGGIDDARRLTQRAASAAVCAQEISKKDASDVRARGADLRLIAESLGLLSEDLAVDGGANHVTADDYADDAIVAIQNVAAGSSNTNSGVATNHLQKGRRSLEDGKQTIAGVAGKLGELAAQIIEIADALEGQSAVLENGELLGTNEAAANFQTANDALGEWQGAV